MPEACCWSAIGLLWSAMTAEIAGSQMLNLRRMGDAAASGVIK